MADDFEKEFDELFGDFAAPVEDPEIARRRKILDAYNKLPAYEKPVQALSDMMRLGADSLTFGVLSNLHPNPDKYNQDIAEASLRAGVPGVGMQLAGAVKSPIVKGIGKGFNMARPSATGILPAIGRGAINVAEGATTGAVDALLRGNYDKVKDQMEMGGAIGGIIPLLLGAAGKAGKVAAGYFSDIKPEIFSKAFKAGQNSEEAANFALGQKGSAAPPKLFKQEQHGFIPTKPLKEAFAGLKKQYFTAQGTFKGTPTEEKAYRAMREIFRGKKGINAEEADALRLQLDDFAKSDNAVISTIAKTFQDGIKTSIAKNSKTYLNEIQRAEDLADANFAGRNLQRTFKPGGTSLLGLGLGFPKFYGDVAHKAGKVAGTLKRENVSPGMLALLAKLQQQERQRDREEK